MVLLNKTRAIKIIDYISQMKLFFKLILILSCVSINGQTLLHTNGKAIVNANGDTVILRTMNLGGWMLIEQINGVFIFFNPIKYTFATIFF